MKFKHLMVLPMLAAPLTAAEPASPNPFEFNLNAVVANADLNRMVRSGNLAGYALGFGMRTEIRPGLNARLHVALMSIRGADGTGLDNANRPHVTGGLDIMQDVNRWTFYGGLTANQWKQAPNPTLPNYSGANAATGVKMGFRLGAEYAFTKNIRGNLAFNLAEFNKVLNPSWFSLGATYRFN